MPRPKPEPTPSQAVAILAANKAAISKIRAQSKAKDEVPAVAVAAPPAVIVLAKEDKQKLKVIIKAASEVLARRTKVLAELNALGKSSHGFLLKHGFIGAQANANHECVTDLDKIDLKKIALWDDSPVAKKARAPKAKASAAAGPAQEAADSSVVAVA